MRDSSTNIKVLLGALAGEADSITSSIKELRSEIARETEEGDEQS